MAGEGIAGNIVLIGLPGVGKSTLGIVLAKIAQKDFIDTDLIIQKKHGASLQALIDELGADAFIALEGEVLCEVEADNAIISTGGSAIYADEAMAHLATLGKIVYLQISFESLKERLIDLEERGVVLRDGVSTSLRDLYEERLPLYEKYADVVVNIDDLSITAAARKVAAACRG